MSLFAELQRRNVVRVGIAYTVIAWLLAQVAEFSFDAFGAPEWALKTLIIVLLLGLPVALIFAWAFEMTPEGLKLEKDVDRNASITGQTSKKLERITLIGIVLVIAFIVGDRMTRGPEAPETTASIDASPAAVPGFAQVSDKSIAVLPFVSMTASQEDEFFADGLSEELLNVLAKIDGLKVAGRTSAFYYKGRNEDLRDIADALGVAHILEGSVRRSGNRIRVTAQLIQANDGFHLWSETYDRDDGDIFVIQDEISGNVAKALQATILGDDGPSETVFAGNAEAQNIYLVAQASLARRSLVDIRGARDLYARASALDPSNPRYLAGYATAVALQYWNYRDITPDEAITEASAAIEQALSLAEPTADILAIAGLVEELRVVTLADPEAKARALAYYNRALELEPDNILALQWLASIYLDINEPDKSRIKFERVVALDPLNTIALTGLGNAYFALGRYEQARVHLFKVQSLFPHLGMAYRYLSSMDFQSGRRDKAQFWTARSVAIDPNPLEMYFYVMGYAALGWADEALEAAEEFRRTSSGTDISRLVQARLDLDFGALAIEARKLSEATGESQFADLTAWAEAANDNCPATIEILERLYPSLKGEVIEYMDRGDLGSAVLLAYCNKKTGRIDEAARLVAALFASDPLANGNDDSFASLGLVRVGLHTVAGDLDAALTHLASLDPTRLPVAGSPLALTVDRLPIFDALADEAPFKKYAAQERYRIAQQARMLASKETEEEIRQQVAAAGFELSDWR